MTEEEIALIRGIEQEEVSLMDIAIVRGHAYAQEYNPSTGRVEDKPNYHALKEGYVHGFLAGFAYRMGGGIDGDPL